MKETLILKAAQFAAQKHKNCRRKDPEKSPYIIHPISVALVIAETGDVDDPEVLAAALLHDTIEDTDTTSEELTSVFGEKVCRLVEEVSDDKSLEKAERKRLQIEHAPELSPEAVLIKLGDKISNVKDVTNSPPADWNVERRMEYLDWTEKVITNCPKVNSALEQHFTEVLEVGRRSLHST